MTKTIPTWLDVHPRDYKNPTVVRFKTPDSQFSWGSRSEIRYAVCGTDYGYIHTTSGDVRTWASYSGARRFLRDYVAARTEYEGV